MSELERGSETELDDKVKILPYVPFPPFDQWVVEPSDQESVTKAFERTAQALESVPPQASEDALSVVAKWAAIDTGAIEGLYEVDRGFTYNVAVSSVMLEDIARLKGHDVRRSIEDAIEAYDYVLDASTGAWPLNESWLRELHTILTRSQLKYKVLTDAGLQEHDLAHGAYKRYPNNPFNYADRAVHSYAPPHETSHEVARLMGELNSPAFLNAPAVIQASYAHYAFVAIHPFADGNGRVARALASAFLYRALKIPLVIFSDQKSSYIDALEAADRGQYQRFVQFIRARLIETLNTVREQVLAAAVPDVATTLGGLSGVLRGPGGLAHEHIDQIAITLMDQLYDASLEVFGTAVDTAPLQIHSPHMTLGRTKAFEGYRTVPDSPRLILKVAGVPPASALAELHLTVGVALPGRDIPVFAIASDTNPSEFAADLEDLYPAISTSVRYRLKLLAERLLRGLVSSAAAKAEQSLREAGYLPRPD